MIRNIYVALIAMMMLSCDSKPKVIAADEVPQADTPSAALSADQSGTTSQQQGATAGGVHQVVAQEILQAERYTYLRVSEGNRTFWIATAKTEAQKGGTYLYKDGLMKTNFESVEFKRTFDTIYLISHIIDASQHPGGNLTTGSGSPATQAPGSVTAPPTATGKVIKISELFKNKSQYNGQEVTVSGKVIKVNNGIMGRNWIHLDDGSKMDGKKLDLTLTTSMAIPLGSGVTLRGTVAVDKDFGAGYRYDVIVENAGN